MVENAIVDDFKHAVPLSPQWLASKNGDSKAVAELPMTPKGSDLDMKRGGGETVEKKKDWRRTASPAMGGIQDRERWREDERDTNLAGGRRWVEPHGRDPYDGRRDGKWSSRWGPDDKEKEFRRDNKWDVERADRAPDGYRDRFGREAGGGWTLHSSTNRGPKTAGFGRGKGTAFAAGRGKATPAPGSYSAALSGAGSRTAIGAPSAPEIANSSSFKYPRAKLLDIYRSYGGTSAFSEKLQNMGDLPDVTVPVAQDPLAFIPPDEDEKAALDSVWNAKSASDAQKLKDDAGMAKENDCQDINFEIVKEKRDEVLGETQKISTEPPVAPEESSVNEAFVETVSKLNVDSDDPPIEATETKNVAEDLYLRYIDPQGIIQGPFSGRDIITWYEAEYFTSELLVREETAPETAPFVPLKEVMPHLVNSSHGLHKASEEELEGLKDCFPDKQSVALSSILPVESSILPASVPMLPVQNPLRGLRDEHLVHQFVQKERSYAHELEELELAQIQQLEQTRQHAQPLPQPALHLQPPFLDQLHAKTGLARALSVDRTLDPIRREQLAQHYIEQQALQNDYQHGLLGLEKQMLQQHGERLLTDQYLQMMQPRNQQEMIFQVLQQKHHEMLQQELLQQKQHQHELLQQKQHQHELLQQKQHELLQQKQHEILQQKQHELLQQKQHELLQQKQHELNRLMNLQQQMNFPERRITGVWKVDESGHPMRVMENHPRLQHQSSLPPSYNRDTMVSPFDGRDRALGNLDLRGVGGMQRLSNENAFLHQPRQEVHQGISKEALQAIMTGAANRGVQATSSWGMHEQYMKDLQAEHTLLQSQKLERQGMSSQDYIVQQLMRNQQLHDRKVKIEQQMMQPSLEKLWAEDFDLKSRNLPHANFGTSAPGVSEMYLKQSAPLQNQGFDVQKGFPSGSVSSYDGIITDDFHGPVREVESRKVKADASDLHGRKFENGIQNLASHHHSLTTKTAEVASQKSPGIQDFDSAKLLNMKSLTGKLSNGNLQQAAHTVTNSDFPTLTKGSAIPLAPQTLYTTAEVKTFRRWCETQIKELLGSNDMSRLEHCILLPSALEAEHYLTQYLGTSPTAQAFKGEFLRCRELMTPQMIQVFVANSEGKDASSDAKTVSNNQPPTVKKKSKKVKKLDPSLLGFNVASNRMLMGEIHHVDSL